MATSSALEALSEAQCIDIKKSSTARLLSILASASFAEAAIAKLGGTQLMEAVAELWVEATEKTAKTKPPEEGELEERRLDSERWREEMEFRKMQMEWEKQRWTIEQERIERDREEGQVDRELQRFRFETEQKRHEREADKRRERTKAEDKKQKSLVVRLKLAGDSLKHALPQQPQDSAELPLYFNTIEALFASFQVDKDLQAKLHG